MDAAATSGVQAGDELLVALVLAGDRNAWFELDRRWRKRLIGLTRSILHDEDLAHEAAQAALCRVFEHLDRYNPSYRFESWILAVGGNVARDLSRDMRKRPGRIGDEILADVADAAPDGPSATVLVEEFTALRECITGLKERSRIVVTMHMTGFSLAEIGRVFHRPKSTIQTWLERIKEQLRRCLSEKGFAEP